MLFPSLLSVVFATAALSKLIDRDAFTRFTASLPRFGLPVRFARRPVAVAIIVAELATVVLVFAMRRVGCVIAACLLAAFTAGIVVALRRGGRAPCRCFGISYEPFGPEHVVRNAFLVACAVLGATWPLQSSGHVTDVVLGVVGALLGFLITRMEDVLWLFPISTSRRLR